MHGGTIAMYLLMARQTIVAQQKKSMHLPLTKPKMSELDKLQQVQDHMGHTWEKIKDIIASKGIPNNEEWLDYAILNRALECGKKDIANLLLDKQCRVNRIEYIPHNTPLHNAVMLEDARLVSKLLEKGASVSALNSAGNSPLHFAFKYRQEHIVNLMLFHILQTENYINPKNLQGLSHLHIASTRKNQTLVKNFLESGADASEAINADSPLWPGYTAMHFAVEFGSLDAAKVLQSAKADNLRDGFNKTAVELAYDKVHESSIVAHILGSENVEYHASYSFGGEEHLFLDQGHYTFPSYFHLACMRKNSNVVEKFIKSGAKVNTPISRFAVFCPLYTPLHFAVESNCVDNVKILLKLGANVSLKNQDKMTALHLALYNEDVSEKNGIVDRLYIALKNKEEYWEDKNGMTYMHIACTRNDVSLVKHFLDRFQDANGRIKRNPRKFSMYTPLHFAIRYRAFEVAQMLVQNTRANVNAPDDGESGTPLHLACETGHAGMIDLLLKNGARANVVRTKDRKTPIHLLVESYIDQREAREMFESFDMDGYDEVQSAKYQLEPFIKRLVEFGANVNAKDKDNDTALHIACSNFWDGSECAKLLIEVGADVNLEDGHGQTALSMALQTCRESYNELAVLYHHVQKLKSLGLKVNPKNDLFCEEFLKGRDEWYGMYDDIKDEALTEMGLQRRLEIDKMKRMMIERGITLFDILVSDARSLKRFAMNPTLKAIAEAKDLKVELPMFAFMVKLQYQKAVKSLEGGKKRVASNETAKVEEVKRNRLE